MASDLRLEGSKGVLRAAVVLERPITPGRNTPLPDLFHRQEN
jgi:hypothetical protein